MIKTKHQIGCNGSYIFDKIGSLWSIIDFVFASSLRMAFEKVKLIKRQIFGKDMVYR